MIAEKSNIKSSYETIAGTYVEYFVEHGEEKTIEFIFGNSFTLAVLNSLYENFLKEGIEPMGKIPEVKKEKYWEIAKKYYHETKDRIRASKAMYVLELITSTY